MQQDAADEMDVQVPGEETPEGKAPLEEAPEIELPDDEVVEDGGAEIVPVDDTHGLTELEVVQAQVLEWKEVAIRATADLDNFRKRMSREKSDAVRYANQGLLEELLPVLDNFDMGLQAAAADEESMIYQGMKMVKKQLDDFLAAQGVDEVQAEGENFDVNVHEAVAQEESVEAEAGSVLRVMRKGYKMGDRLLRAANVVVAKAPEENSGQSGEGEA